MTSIFDIPQSVSELKSANGGISKIKYTQVPCSRDISGDNFPSGVQSFKFQTSSPSWLIPARSYIRMRATFKKGANALTIGECVAPAFGCIANLYQSLEFRINDKTISRISDFVGQVDAIHKRTTKSESWMKTIGASLNFYDDDFNHRVATVSSDGKIVGESDSYLVQANIPSGGYTAATTVAYTVATHTITFAVAGNDTDTHWVVGDKIKFISAPTTTDLSGTIATVTAVGSSTKTIQIDSELLGSDIASELITFARIRSPDSRRVKNVELVWQPPLSIFGINHALPTGRYELVMNPHSSTAYQTRAVESYGISKTYSTDFTFYVNDLYFNACVCEGPRFDNGSFLIDLESIRCQPNTITAAGLSQKIFDVSPSTYGLAIAFQDTRAGSSTLVSPSRFKAYNTAYTEEQDLLLTRLYLSYAGLQLPQPDSDPTFVTGSNEDYTAQRYAETQLYTGQYFNAGSGESIETWQRLGPYHYFSFPKDSEDRSTRVITNHQFTTADNMNVLLFDWSRQVCRVQVENGSVVDVQLEDA